MARKPPQLSASQRKILKAVFELARVEYQVVGQLYGDTPAGFERWMPEGQHWSRLKKQAAAFEQRWQAAARRRGVPYSGPPLPMPPLPGPDATADETIRAAHAGAWVVYISRYHCCYGEEAAGFLQWTSELLEQTRFEGEIAAIEQRWHDAAVTQLPA